MPLYYPTGTIKEHLACRNEAVIFDVSHLGTVRKTGESAFLDLQNALTNDLGKIEPGRCQYTHLLNDAGYVVDDIIVWWLTAEEFFVMPNASNTDNVLAAIGGSDITQTRSVLALQGPRARELVAKLNTEIAAVPFNRVLSTEYFGTQLIVAGTGYTGEDGIEIHVENSHAELLFKKLLDIGFLPAGLGARDTLRLEAGLPLYGHEISLTRNSIEANLSWVISLTKDNFIGKDAILRIKSEGTQQKLFGLKGNTRKPLRENDVVKVDNVNVGVVVSGNYSPVLNVGIATAYINVDLGLKAGDPVIVESRTGDIQCHVADLPFLKHNRTAKNKS